MSDYDYIDLSWHAQLPSKWQLYYRETSLNLRKDFCSLIDDVSSSWDGSLDGWLVSASMRDQYSSRLFHDIVTLVMLKNYKHEIKDGDSIVIDDPTMFAILKIYANNNQKKIQIFWSTPLMTRMIKNIRTLLSPLRTHFRIFSEWLTAKLGSLDYTPNLNLNKDLIVIDTFAIPGFVLEDRYYSGLWELLSQQDKSKVRFIPQFSEMTLNQIYKATIDIKKHPERFILKDQLIKLTDLLWAAGHWYRRNKINISRVDFSGFEITPLIRRELSSTSALNGALRGLLNYRFVMRLSQIECNVVKAIDWFENQGIDRGWSAGFRRFLPKATTMGYQGFSSSAISTKPTTAEQRAGVIPQTIAVMGSAFIKPLREFCPDLDITVAPAFRFKWVWEYNASYKKQNKNPIILIALPGEVRICRKVLELVSEASKEMAEIEYRIKTHPRAPLSSIFLKDDSWKKWAVNASRSLKEEFSDATLIIGAEFSTVGMEAVSIGLPTIFVVPQGGVSGLMPEGVPDTMWSIATDVDSLVQLVPEFVEMSNHDSNILKLAGEARSYMFEPVTNQTAIKFITA